MGEDHRTGEIMEAREGKIIKEGLKIWDKKMEEYEKELERGAKEARYFIEHEDEKYLILLSSIIKEVKFHYENAEKAEDALDEIAVLRGWKKVSGFCRDNRALHFEINGKLYHFRIHLPVVEIRREIAIKFL